MATTHKTKFLIIGAGPAGYTAAIYSARANLKPILVQGMQPGGQLTITTDVENYPGFADPIQGPWLMEQMKAQAENMGTELLTDVIVDVDFSQRPFICKGDSGDIYEAETVCIATGAKARWLGLESETEYQNAGVSACATCDGFFFREKEVCVVGGGNTAMEEALYLANICKKVTLIHRRDQFRGEKILQDRVMAHEKIDVRWNSVVSEIEGAANQFGMKSVSNVKLKDTVSSVESDLPVSGVFIAIGHDPATAVFKGKVDLDSEGYIVTKADSTATSIEGVYAAGDVQDKTYRQAVTAAGMGCMAALEAERFLTGS